MTELVLQHGFSFGDLYEREGLVRLDRAFVAHLAETATGLHDRLMAARRDSDAVERLEELNLLVDLAPQPPRSSRTQQLAGCVAPRGWDE
jgi:hypothetical protein